MEDEQRAHAAEAAAVEDEVGDSALDVAPLATEVLDPALVRELSALVRHDVDHVEDEAG